MNDEKKTQAPPERVVTPYVNIREEEDEVILEAELPGVDRKGLNISIDGDELTLNAKREAGGKGMKAIRREIAPCVYRRTFILGNVIDREKIEAKLENGLLTLILPKSAETKPRKIEIS